jgi:hypothetical protein
MSNGVTASRNPARRVRTEDDLALKPLPWPLLSDSPALGPHRHHCLSCGSAYRCQGPVEVGYCAPVCPPCHWIELGSQLRIYKEMVTELERTRSGIERRIGKAVCRNAAARRRKVKANASLLVAFGNVLSMPPAPKSAGPSMEAQREGSHE